MLEERVMIRQPCSASVSVTRLWRLSFFALLPLIALLAGCKKKDSAVNADSAAVNDQRKTLTSQLITKYELKDEDFKQLQYYLAGDLVLRREVQKEEKKEKVKGKLVERFGKIEEEVLVKAGTPGVCLNTKEEDGKRWLEISFEEGTSFKFV
jgi:hypothetical protein